MKFLVSRNIILLGLLMFGTGSILAGEVFPIDVEKIAGGDFLYWRISSLIREMGIILVSGTMIISGFKDLRTKGRSPGGILRISSGILICLILLILCFYVRSVLIEVRTSFFAEDGMNMIESVLADNHLPDKNRLYWEKARAKEYYLRYGEFLEYTTEQGEKKIYQPT